MYGIEVISFKGPVSVVIIGDVFGVDDAQTGHGSRRHRLFLRKKTRGHVPCEENYEV